MPPAGVAWPSRYHPVTMLPDDVTRSARAGSRPADGDRSESGPGRDLSAPAYGVVPIGLGRRPGRRPAVVLAAVAVLLAVVVVKPWAPPDGLDRSGVAITPFAVPSRAALTSPSSLAAAATDPPWPAIAKAGAASDLAPMTIGSLARRWGTWGVGEGGLGARIEGDAPWADWVPVEPEAATDTPIHIAIWPGTGICAGVPRLLDQPLFFAITTTADLPVDRPLEAWWTDGGRAAALDGSVHQVTPAGEHGVSYLVRDDNAPWPAGRYEFHVTGGNRTFALTICIPATG